MTSPVLTPLEAGLAAFPGKTLEQLQRLCRRGHLPGVKVGSRWFLRDFESWLARQETTSRPPPHGRAPGLRPVEDVDALMPADRRF